MSGLFGGGGNAPTRISGVQITQSELGLPLPVVMGRGKIQQSLLWMDGFTAKKESQGGKGGGKGSSFYLYACNVVAGLCEGPITAINDVWAGQSWLSNNSSVENYTIAGSGIYTPTNASVLIADAGAGILSTYSGSYADSGAPSQTVLNGTNYAPMKQVAYGTTLTTGTYSINPADGTYHFDVADDSGKQVQLSYSYRLQYIRQQENDVVPAGKSVSVGGTFTFNADLGVRYVGGANDGIALTKVSGTPSATGTYSVSGSAPATYLFATGDVGVEVQVTYQIEDDAAVGQDQPTMLSFTMFNGAKSQSEWSLLSGTFPAQAIGYTRTAYLGYAPMDLGTTAQVNNVVVEVSTADAYGSGIVDCNPVQCITQVLTNDAWGLGAGATPFPSYVIDNGPLGTWGGAAGTPGVHAVGNTAFLWWAANGFFISPVIDQQDSASSIIGKWLESGMVAGFMSEGLFKLVSYGDTSTAANGATWVAPSNFVVALDDSCFIGKEGEDPVKISRSAWQDGYNSVQVNYNNRGNQYSPELIQESDQASIDRYGLRLEDPQAWDFITELPAATFAANMRVKRSVNIRNTYVFSVPFVYSYLEPMDIITISTTSIWAQGLNNTNLGVNNLPVRIQKIVDDPEAGLEVTAEDYPFGAHQPVIFNKSISSGNVVSNAYANPGDSEVVMFEATNRLTGFAGNQIWIGATGASDNWGSTNIYVSQDGTNYLQVGTIQTQARIGVLDSTLATGSDPDTTHSLVVDMAENSPTLDAGSSTDADLGTTMCFVDGEIISYSACAISGQDQYTMNTYMRRGQMGSTISAHSAGSLFMRLDDAVFKFTYDPTWAGKTLSFKFQSVNAFGNNPQPLGSLTPVSFTIPGLNPGSIDASTGLVIGAAAGQGQCPVSVPTTVTASLSSGGLTSAWTAGNAVVLPGTVEFDVYSTGGIVDVLLWASNDGSSKPNGYMLRFDGRASFIAGQVLKITSGAWSNIETAKVSANASALMGWHHVKAQIGNGQMDVFVDGIYTATAIDRTYTPTGATYYGYEVDTGASIAPTGMTAKTQDNLPDGITYARVQTTALTSGNVDPTKTGVLMKGSIPPTINGGFTYTSTSTTITWTWPANTAVYRADGTITLIGAGSQAVTGLSLNRAYYFYPVYNEATATLKFISSSDVTFPSVVGYTGNGTTGYVSTTTAVSQPGNFSVECWINTTSASVQPMFDLSAPQVIGTAGNKSFTMWFQGSTITAVGLLGSSVITTLASVSANTKLNDGNTHHIVLTWDNTAHACVVYVDGVLQTNSATPASAFTAISTMFWHIGGVNGKASWTLTANTFATASISNAAFYNAVLTATQVSNHYQSLLNISVAQYNTIVAADTPVYWWKLNETAGTSAADSAGSNTGTYQGTVTLNVSNEAYGADGSPSIAWVSTSYLTVQASVLQGNIPLTSGSITATPASGGSGGGGGIGGGAGGGGCFSPNTLVKTERGSLRFDELQLSDKVLTASGAWRSIAKILTHDWTHSMLDMGNNELITYKHRVLDAREWKHGADIFGGSKPYSGTVWNLEVETDEKDGLCFSPMTEHSYQLANGFFVHNGPVGDK